MDSRELRCRVIHSHIESCIYIYIYIYIYDCSSSLISFLLSRIRGIREAKIDC